MVVREVREGVYLALCPEHDQFDRDVPAPIRNVRQQAAQRFVA